jgi:diguanylate cyclase (GGDEF)-like protein
MRLFQRQDALLLIGLTVALIIIFSPSISQLVDFTRELERERGVTLLPALIVLTGVFVVHQLRKRLEGMARETAAQAAHAEAEVRIKDLERLVAFGHALARSLDHEAIRSAINQQLARLAGTEHVWVMLRQGTSWEALAGDTRGAEEVVERASFAERIIDGAEAREGGQTVGFPLVVGGTAIGVMGVKPASDSIDQGRHRAIEAAATLLAVSLKNAQLFKEVRENSMRDPLTGCVMRTHASEIIDAELRRARRSLLPISMILFDLDHFTHINDKFGHLCGDAVLGAIGRCMRDVLRGSDLKCRYGGEEFLVLLPETPLHGARRVAETLRREIADRPILWAGHTLAITASFGLTQARPGEMSTRDLVERADVAMHRAKQEGRNCIRVAPDETAENTEGRNPAVTAMQAQGLLTQQ